MFVRPLNPDEVLSALHLIWEVYASDVAPLQNPEAVAGFRELIRYEHIMPRIQNKEVILFGAWEGTELCGVGGINNRGNVLLLYVRKEWKRKGVARQLMQGMYQFCAQVLVITRMTVRAVPASVTVFNHLGFREVAPVQNVGAEIFVPMELLIAPGSMPAKKPKKRIALIIVGVCLLIALLICMVVKEAASIVQESDTYAEEQENPFGDYGNGDSGEYDFGMGDGSETEQQSGLDQIPEYSGNPYVEINGNIPSFSDEKSAGPAYEFYSELDSLGRCGYAESKITPELMPDEERGAIGMVKPTGWHTVKYENVDGRYLYNRCHLIGYQLTGENANRKNLITGTRYLNVTGMLPFENEVADYVHSTGNPCMYRVTPFFKGDELVARGVEMEAESVKDQKISFHVFVYNIQPGIEIDYTTGNSWEE